MPREPTEIARWARVLEDLAIPLVIPLILAIACVLTVFVIPHRRRGTSSVRPRTLGGIYLELSTRSVAVSIRLPARSNLYVVVKSVPVCPSFPSSRTSCVRRFKSSYW